MGFLSISGVAPDASLSAKGKFHSRPSGKVAHETPGLLYENPRANASRGKLAGETLELS